MADRTSTDVSPATSLRRAAALLALLTLLTGVVYPALVTGIAHLAFPNQAAGSLVVRDGRVVGSSLVGQAFGSPRYLWGRPSATVAHAYDGALGAASNLGPTNPALREAARARIEALRAAGLGDGPVPVDLVTASGSGLDPHVSVASARAQVPRIARARGLAPDAVARVVERHVETRALGFLGEPRVNVLAVNLALDAVE